MTSFTTTPTAPAAKVLPNPSKHVNFTTGMVLGVDDLTQEFAYLSNLSLWQARDLLGYGTVCGLKVSNDGPKVYVSPGVALNPRGQLIKVNPTQCANLNAWLKGEKENVQAKLITSSDHVGAHIRLYVTLCYRECQTDSLPIPGEPCRSDSDDASLMQPSRLQDDFSLDLSWDAPEQTEEDALRRFVEWLRQIKVGETSLTADKFAKTISDAIKEAQEKNTKLEDKDKKSPLELLDEILQAVDDTTVAFSSAEVSEFLRAAFRIWTTELRPLVRGAHANCVNSSQVDCVLLAELELSLAGDELSGWTVDGDVKINEAHRPFLLHLRMIQEWMLGEGFETGVMTEPTRLLALSWVHGGNMQLDINLDGATRKGLIVAFGKRTLNDGGKVRVGPGSLDEETFQIFTEAPSTAAGVDFWTYRRIRPDAILPVKDVTGVDGLVTQANTVTDSQTGAAALLLSNAAFNYMKNKKVIVVIKGDYVLDETGEHAIRAGTVRHGLPSGEGGGNFESWMWIGLLININTATAVELQALSGIGPTIAANIIAYRTDPNHGNFTSIDGLLAVSGIGAELLNGIRPFITITP